MTNAFIKNKKDLVNMRNANITIRGDILDAAREYGINISQACDNYLSDLVKREQQKRWKDEFSEFISAYNTILQTEKQLSKDQESF